MPTLPSPYSISCAVKRSLGVAGPRIDAKGIRIRVYGPRRCELERMRHEDETGAYGTKRDQPDGTKHDVAFAFFWPSAVL